MTEFYTLLKHILQPREARHDLTAWMVPIPDKFKAHRVVELLGQASQRLDAVMEWISIRERNDTAACVLQRLRAFIYFLTFKERCEVHALAAALHSRRKRNEAATELGEREVRPQ